MDDDDDSTESDLISALYKALDRLEEVDPTVRREEWFKFLEKAVDESLANGVR